MSPLNQVPLLYNKNVLPLSFYKTFLFLTQKKYGKIWKKRKTPNTNCRRSFCLVPLTPVFSLSSHPVLGRRFNVHPRGPTYLYLNLTPSSTPLLWIRLGPSRSHFLVYVSSTRESFILTVICAVKQRVYQKIIKKETSDLKVVIFRSRNWIPFPRVCIHTYPQ